MVSRQEIGKKQEDDVKLEKSYFEIMGLCCSSEVPLIEGIVKPLNGVKELSVVVPTKTLMVVHDINTINPSQIGKYFMYSYYLKLSYCKYSCDSLCLISQSVVRSA